MGRSMRLVALLVVCTAAVSAVPLADEADEGVALVDKVSGLFSDSEDESTVEAQINQAIGHDVNMDNIGEAQADDSSSKNPWIKRTQAAIASMSNSEMAKAKTAPEDKITAQMEADAQQAKAVIEAPKKKKKLKKTAAEVAEAAMKDPKQAKQLKKYAAEAELEMDTSMLPVTFVDETPSDDTDDFGESDDIQLMDGSDGDVMKQINQQIGEKVSAQLGSIPVNDMDVSTMKKFEEDKAEASKDLAEANIVPTKKVDAAQVKTDLEAAKKSMNSIMNALDDDEDEDRDKDEEDEDEDEDEY